MAQTSAPNRRRSWTPLRLPAGDHAFVHATGESFESTDPATGDTVATLATSTTDDLDQAVSSAGEAFRTSAWPSDGALRARVLFAFAAALRADGDRLAELLTRDQGK